MFSELEKYTTKPAAVPDEPPVKPAVAPKPPVKAAETPPVDPNAAPADPAATPTPGDIPEPDRNKPKPDKTFWQSFDAWKKRATEAETRLASLTTETDRKTFEQRVQAAETRVQELENIIRFVDYSKSAEFQTKYEQPYKQAWTRAMSEVGQLKVVTDPQTGATRPASAEDLGALVNLPLGDARALATQMFGDFADDVMAYRKEIRTLWDAQSEALETAKKEGANREQQTRQQFTTAQETLSKNIRETWEKANSDSLAHPKMGQYFKPVEGNDEVNNRLTKGFALVDQAFGENPTDPRLTPEQRAQVVRRHAAVRNRAAAFGSLVYQLESAQAKIAELTKKLDGIESTTPNTAGRGGPTPAPAAGGSARDQLYGALQKIARPE